MGVGVSTITLFTTQKELRVVEAVPLTRLMVVVVTA